MCCCLCCAFHFVMSLLHSSQWNASTKSTFRLCHVSNRTHASPHTHTAHAHRTHAHALTRTWIFGSRVLAGIDTTVHVRLPGLEVHVLHRLAAHGTDRGQRLERLAFFVFLFFSSSSDHPLRGGHLRARNLVFVFVFISSMFVLVHLGRCRRLLLAFGPSFALLL